MWGTLLSKRNTNQLSNSITERTQNSNENGLLLFRKRQKANAFIFNQQLAVSDRRLLKRTGNLQPNTICKHPLLNPSFRRLIGTGGFWGGGGGVGGTILHRVRALRLID